MYRRHSFRKSQAATTFLNQKQSEVNGIVSSLDALVAQVYNSCSDSAFYQFATTTGTPEESLAELKERMQEAAKLISTGANYLRNLQEDFANQFAKIAEPTPPAAPQPAAPAAAQNQG